MHMHIFVHLPAIYICHYISIRIIHWFADVRPAFGFRA